MTLRAEFLRPAALGASERAAWLAMMAATPGLRRAFFSPGFACAVDAAQGRAWVAVLHEGGTIRAFFPFQFRSAWHARVRLAERIGHEMNDNAGLVAAPGFRIDPVTLLRRCRLGGAFMHHLTEEQTGFGLDAAEWRIGHVIDIADGADAYFARLTAERKPFVQDTERRLRRAARDWGTLDYSFSTSPDPAELAALIENKRAQYRRTGVRDVLARDNRLRLIDTLVAQDAPDCRAVLTILRAGDRVLARHLGLLHDGVLSYWLPNYDPEAQKVSPGRLLMWNTIRNAAAHGLVLIDRGEGDNEAKRDFSTGTRRFGMASWFAGTPRAAAARLWQAAAWRAYRYGWGAGAHG